MRLGNIRISDGTILRWLDYPDASILSVSHDPTGFISIILNSEEMPEVYEGSVLQVIEPVFHNIPQIPIREKWYDG